MKLTEMTQNELNLLSYTEIAYRYLKENKVRLRDEVGLISDYYRSTAQDYVVHCAIREGKTSLLDLSISVPDKEQAEHMCSRWNKENQAIYQNIMKLLMK